MQLVKSSNITMLYFHISKGIIEKLKECKTKKELQVWGEKNSIATRLLGANISKKIYDEYLTLYDSLPEDLEEDIDQSKESNKSTKKAKSGQIDIEELTGKEMV